MKIQSLERAFNIIELLADEHSGMTLSDIARRLSLPVSTVHRIITDLMEKGYVEKGEGQNLFRVGLRFVDLSSLYLNSLELKTEARPVLTELCSRVNLSVFLATLVDDEVCYIDRVTPFPTMRGYSIIGQRQPVSITSLGKALIMDWDDNMIREFIDREGLAACTPYSITDPELFVENMRMIKKRGWSSDIQEGQLEFQCVGAPIYDYRNEIIAALSIAWDRRFFDSIIPDEIAGIAVEAAGDISRRLGAKTAGSHGNSV